MTNREERLLLFAALAAAVGTSGNVRFWQAFKDDNKRIFFIQRQLEKELNKLENELWPPDEGW